MSVPGNRLIEMLRGGLNRVANGTPSPYLLPEEQAAAAEQRRMAMAASLLQNAGRRPVGTGPGVLGGIGEAMQAGNAAQANAQQDAIKMRMLQAQMAQLTQGNQPQDPNDLRMMRALGFPLNQEGLKAYTDATSRPGTTINVGDDKLNEPIPISQLDSVRLPNGQPPPIGTTFAQARDAGARVMSPAEVQRGQQADQALGILGQLKDLAVGENGVFREVAPGLANRAGSAFQFGLNMITQDDPRASQFYDMSRATLAPFIKFLGESGALAQGDVDRALGLVPRIFPLPDTEQVAREKLATLEEIISRGVKNLNSGGAQRPANSLPPLPPGFTLDE